MTPSITQTTETGQGVIVTLPFPAKILWPNGRGHWANKAREVKASRRNAWASTLEAIGGRAPDWSAAKLVWTIHPKTAHTIDDDAPPSALKSYRDGIADALRLDDKFFTASYAFAEPVKGGLVRVEISPVVTP